MSEITAIFKINNFQKSKNMAAALFNLEKNIDRGANSSVINSGMASK
jgi:hypothetical protein